MSNNDALLEITLQAAVPLWIEKLKRESPERILEIARECGDFIAEHGDVVQFKSSPAENKKFGGTAAAFNHLAQGLACLAFAPGGVKFLGSRWEATHPDAWDAT